MSFVPAQNYDRIIEAINCKNEKKMFAELDKPITRWTTSFLKKVETLYREKWSTLMTLSECHNLLYSLGQAAKYNRKRECWEYLLLKTSSLSGLASRDRPHETTFFEGLEQWCDKHHFECQRNPGFYMEHGELQQRKKRKATENKSLDGLIEKDDVMLWISHKYVSMTTKDGGGQTDERRDHFLLLNEAIKVHRKNPDMKFLFVFGGSTTNLLPDTKHSCGDLFNNGIYCVTDQDDIFKYMPGVIA